MNLTPIFLYCLNDADISFLESDTSTELNDLFSRSSRANVSARLELGRGQICTKLNPYAFFGVRDNAIMVYADVKRTSLVS